MRLRTISPTLFRLSLSYSFPSDALSIVLCLPQVVDATPFLPEMWRLGSVDCRAALLNNTIMPKIQILTAHKKQRLTSKLEFLCTIKNPKV